MTAYSNEEWETSDARWFIGHRRRIRAHCGTKETACRQDYTVLINLFARAPGRSRTSD